jgi:hypothetical protein
LNNNKQRNPITSIQTYPPQPRARLVEIRVARPDLERGIEAAAPQHMITLTSREIPLKTNMGLWTCDGDSALIHRVSGIFQMIPAAQGERGVVELEGGGLMEIGAGLSEQTEPKEVKVEYKRRETERQQSARLRSYEYQRRQEESEPWVQLAVTPGPAGFLVGSLCPKEIETVAPRTFSAFDYLEAIIPRPEVLPGQPDETEWSLVNLGRWNWEMQVERIMDQVQ